MKDQLLRLENVKKYFPIQGNGLRQKRWVRAVDDVSIQVGSNETLGLVGESGCGKTTLANVIVGLEKPTDGQIFLEGQDLTKMKAGELKKARKHIQIVFQDPFLSLNPRWLVRDVIGEPIRVHNNLRQEEFNQEIEELLGMVGLPSSAMYKYPHEFSGGQKQCIAIARALALKPRFIILDEPVSAIDIVSQIQILGMLRELKDRLRLSYILISHDLAVVNEVSDYIAVMYLGKMVEYGPSDLVFSSPAHPYTQALLGAIPKQQAGSIAEIETLEGGIPSAITPPSGCRFHTRCKYAMKKCSIEEPPLKRINHEHNSSCWLLTDNLRDSC
jgi:oligopeptide/dipeptide ABC transporter ATP-binding protein